jgi:predicted N-acetyltransferase YhbS
VTRQTLDSTQTAIEVWEKEPDMAAIRELLDRALDKSKEQEQLTRTRRPGSFAFAV